MKKNFHLSLIFHYGIYFDIKILYIKRFQNYLKDNNEITFRYSFAFQVRIDIFKTD